MVTVPHSVMTVAPLEMVIVRVSVKSARHSVMTVARLAMAIVRHSVMSVRRFAKSVRHSVMSAAPRARVSVAMTVRDSAMTEATHARPPR